MLARSIAPFGPLPLMGNLQPCRSAYDATQCPMVADEITARFEEGRPLN